MSKAEIFARAHKMTRQYKRLGGLGSYRDIFAQNLREAYAQARKIKARLAEAEAEIEAEEAQLVEQKTNLKTQLTICTEMLDAAHARNDYCEIEQHKLDRQEIQRYLRNIDQRLEELAQTRRSLLAA